MHLFLQCHVFPAAGSSQNRKSAPIENDLPPSIFWRALPIFHSSGRPPFPKASIPRGFRWVLHSARIDFGHLSNVFRKVRPQKLKGPKISAFAQNRNLRFTFVFTVSTHPPPPGLRKIENSHPSKTTKSLAFAPRIPVHLRGQHPQNTNSANIISAICSTL